MSLRGLAVLLSLAAAQATADDSLVGLWSYETRYDRALAGRLNINREGERWHATLSGASTQFRPEGDEIRFAFPGDGGRYRGRVTDNGIEGFWIRPAATQDPRFPGGASQLFATPVDLAPESQGLWSGVVKALPDRFTLYLRISKGVDGRVLAAFRNPEQNSRGPASQYDVTRDGDNLRFTAGSDPAVAENTLEARRLSGPDRIRVHWNDVAADIELTRRSDEEAADYFPRPPGAAPYAYRPPAVIADGWETARAGDVGIDEAVVTRMIQGIADSDPSERRPSLIHSLLIARQGKLVVEEYFFGHDRETPHDLRSAGKTFASVLLGAARPKITPDTKVYEAMAERGPFAHPDPRKARITLAHLLTHSAGLACDDYDDASPGNETNMQTQTGQPDWWKYTLDLPMAHEPGLRYAYCSANINLVGGVLTTATATWLPSLFRKQVANPLEFGEWHWNLQPTGEGYLGGGAFLRPRDLLKVGQVYLDGGTWKGRRIVDEAWVRSSTAERIRINPETTALTAEQFGNAYSEGADALAWHLNPVHSGDRVIAAYAATGNGGQLLVVMPEFDLVAVFAGGNYLQGGIWSRWPDQYIGGQIIPAITKGRRNE